MTNKQKTFCAGCGNEIQISNHGVQSACSNCKMYYIVLNGTITFGNTAFVLELYNAYSKQGQNYCNPYGNYCNPYEYYYQKPEYKRIMEPDNTQYISSILSRLSTLENEMKDLKNKK